MDKDLAHTLKEKLSNKYENTTLEILGNSTDSDQCTDFTLYVHFNDHSDNCLAVYSDRNGFAVSNFKNLKGPFKPSTEFSKKANAKTVEGIAQVFHECYEEMFRREADLEAKNKACLREWNIDENLYERVEGPIKHIGRCVNP
jgi:hypothetical protein